VVRMALAYRTRFQADVLIDLIGYRRFGHNEGDEPAYTQPRMYQRISDHPTVLSIWADHLVADGTLSAEERKASWDAAYGRLSDVQREVREASVNGNSAPASPPVEPASLEAAIPTAVDSERLLDFDRQLHRWPDEFQVNPKLERQLRRRGESLGKGDGIDWAHAESLAFATLLAGGTPIRLSGQDSARGTFSQRHLTLRHVETGEAYTPLQALEAATAPFEVYNSPLSEAGVLGFEYGYSIATPDALVLWEAQFGDFVNAAQVILDQFLAAGRAKWGQESRLVLLLPHGYEGQGPEHSSARLERFLQLAAEDNIRVANCTTPGQYFHLLRRQALLEEVRPLVIFTPKSLLRHPKAVSTLPDFAESGFRFIIDDEEAAGRANEIRRVALCSGKVYYDLMAGRTEDSTDVAVVRLEQLYPLAERTLTEVLQGYTGATELVWVQEEPANMGAWTYIRPRLEAIMGERLSLGYAGRPERASPAEGYKKAHDHQQERIVHQAFNGTLELPRVDAAR
jgi:2-oxoglutarate dehydrogenase E1 component